MITKKAIFLSASSFEPSFDIAGIMYFILQWILWSWNTTNFLDKSRNVRSSVYILFYCQNLIWVPCPCFSQSSRICNIVSFDIEINQGCQWGCNKKGTKQLSVFKSSKAKFRSAAREILSSGSDHFLPRVVRNLICLCNSTRRMQLRVSDPLLAASGYPNKKKWIKWIPGHFID